MPVPKHYPFLGDFFGSVRWFSAIVLILTAGLTNNLALAEEPSDVDKTHYNLFNPTPREHMRPLSADRPDATESPITVDAGHLQVELSFFDYTHNEADGDKVDSWSIFDTNVKVGVLNDVDLQFIITAYTEEKSNPAATPSETLTGFGDMQVRLKVNLWGNDEGQTAFGIMHFVKIPSGSKLSNDKVEGGFITMYGCDVAENLGLGLQAEVDFVYDAVDDDYDTEFLHTAVLGSDLLGQLGGYLEYLGIVSTDTKSDYQAFVSFGLTYERSADIIVDVGTLIGLTKAANDFSGFTGITARF